MEEISLLPLREMLHHDDRISHYVVYTLQLEEPCKVSLSNLLDLQYLKAACLLV